jgi:hypothetical protein
VRRLAAAAALAGSLFAADPALAWGNAGHRIIGRLAIQTLPRELPAFLRTPQAARDVGELSREPDRSKDAGKIHDSDRDPGHFIDLDDAGKSMGGPAIGALPPTRAEYETALRAAGSDTWKAGYLPYSIVDRWQQLTKDLAYWRVLTAIERRERNRERKAWYSADRRRREALIFRTLGELSHFVGDGSQPLHVSIHYNGWGNLPNPKGYSNARLHAPFEGEFVHANVKEAAVRAALRPYRDCACAVDRRTADYLTETFGEVEPFYALEKAGGLAPGDRRGVEFATVRIAAGASELRDLILEAWRASAKTEVGWPKVKVADVEAGTADPWEAMLGRD